ncbi:hypothetical protein ACFX1R_028027 [Malus domestica]|uniref:tRNA A64-2'-O-ribosylphosphate transferase isoform X3 n=1 Tax=Malus domestica TaxID=3750 RepID=UPI0010AA5404|nr:uncharacterized protein LOC103449709 isoform X3 [Malus domestica]
MEEDDGTKQLSIYRAARTIKRRQNTLYNALKSIYDDSIFVGEISQLWPDLPLLANLRCGLWYSPTANFHSTCYFKSTDGHTNNWSFNTSRLNLHVAQLAGQKGGCFIVDATRKGKRFPDSMSKTIPIWTCVLNRAIYRHLKKDHQSDLFNDEELSTSGEHSEENGQTNFDWDCSLHLPLWVSETEKASIEDRLDEWTQQLEASGADIASLASLLKKPLRPLWISQKTVIWLNEVPDHESWDFTPIILVSASASNGVVPHRTSSEFSWNYIAGAGDDEESWAKGLTPTLFWNHAYDIIDVGPVLCNQMVADIVEKDRVYRARRGQIAPQVSVKAPNLVENSVHCLLGDSLLPLDISNTNMDLNPCDEDCPMSWMGSTGLAVGISPTTAVSKVDCILNCDQESIPVSHRNAKAYMHLPMVTSKFDRFSLLNNLPSAVNFAKLNLSEGKTLLICCHNGEDISVCICLAILTSLFDDRGTFDGGSFFSETCITKLEMRRRLVTICKYVVNARPSRGNLKQVFGFLNGGRAVVENGPA